MNRCYRHPDRETGVSCQRCDKYICAECSTPGAVGFLCPEDSRDTQRVRRVNFQKQFYQSAPVTTAIIGINVIVYVLQMLNPDLINYLAYANIPGTEFASLQRAFTSAFVHDQTQITHIIMNMFTVFVLGTALEPALGKLRFIALYLLSLFGGVVAFAMLADYGTFVIGASGAGFGLMGALLILQRALRIQSTQLGLLIAVNLVIGFLPGIAWQAHVGGLVVGMLVAAIFVYLRNPKQLWIQIGLVALIAAFLISYLS